MTDGEQERRRRADAAWELWQQQHPSAPTPTPSPAPTAPTPPADRPGHVDPTYAWTVALLPLVWIPFAYLLPGTVGWLWLPLLAATIGLCALDRNRIKVATGIKLAPTDLLLVPAYLIDRTRKLGSTPAIPIVWFAAFAAAVVSMLTFAATFDFDEDWAERQIAKWAREQGAGSVDVDCPSKAAVRAEQVVTCTVSDRRDRVALVEVTVSSDGTYTWSWAS